MKEDIELLVELLFQNCCFDPVYMDETYARHRFRLALESMSDEEYAWVCEKMKVEVR